MWMKLKHWCIETYHQLDNWQSVLLFICIAALMYFPVWGGYLLYFLFHWKWAMWMATAVLAFWAAPFTPFFPLCISLTLALRKFILKIHHRVQRTLHRHSASEKSI